MTKPLLPAGCYDLLPPQAAQASRLSQALLSVFEGFGYEQVSPPLLEYSDNLLAGRGAALSSQIFRVMDPAAHKVMGIRADMTLQIARIASTRLSHAPRPLRLCYDGLILRMQGDRLSGERQLRQAGIELIGPATSEADAEVIFIAAEALKKAGVQTFSIDLNLPGIVGSLLATEKLDEETLKTLLDAVAHKDVSTIQSLSFSYRDTLIGLLQSAGPATKALAAIDKLELPENARRQLHDLKRVADILQAQGYTNLTIDATENRSVGYHCGISFSIFVPGVATEVGRGGRYRIQAATAQADMEATGFTLYVETLLSILHAPSHSKRILVADGVTADIQKLRADGFTIIYALSEYGSSKEEAERLSCNYLYKDGKVQDIS